MFISYSCERNGFNALNKPLDRPDDNREKKHDDGNLIDPVHHSQVEICRFIRIRLSEHIQKVISHLTQLEEFFDLVFL